MPTKNALPAEKIPSVKMSIYLFHSVLNTTHKPYFFVFRFQYPEFLLLTLALLPLVWWVFKRHEKWAEGVLALLGSTKSTGSLLTNHDSGLSRRRIRVLLTALALIILAMANPQLPGGERKTRMEGASIVLVMDVSNSMLVQDAAPNRLERGRLFLQKLTEKLSGHRIGLVIFAGNAYLQAPCNNDYPFILNHLATVGPESAPTQGTGIGDALLKAEMALGNRPGAVVLVTDGEDHQGEAAQQASKLKEKGHVLLVFGVGSEQGGRIPDPLTMDFKRDQSGEPAVSKLEIKTLQDISQAAGGYLNSLVDIPNAIEAVGEKIQQLERGEFDAFNRVAYQSYYQWLLLPAIFLLVLERWLVRR